MEVIGKTSTFTGIITAYVHNAETLRDDFIKKFPHATVVLIHQPNTTIDEQVMFNDA